MPSRAYRAAIAAEDSRNRAIKEGVGQVNAIYGPGREAQYGDYLQALRNRYSASLGDEKTDIDRNTKFDLARRGVTKGSADLDARRNNQRRYIQALIGSENRAQGSVGRLRSADESSRRNLLNLIFGGMDATTATQRASLGMQADLQTAMGDFIPNAIGAAVGSGAGAYSYGTQQRGYRQGQQSAREALYG